MKFCDEGIIISQKKYSENSLIVKIFSRDHGIYRGFVKSAKSTKDRTIFQIGNLVSFEFRSRIEENLGQFFSVDLVKSYCTKIIFDRLRLDCANSIFSIIDNTFLEREIQESLFAKIHDFLQKISDLEISTEIFLTDYIRLELEILKTLGYGIDLSSCVVTSSTVDLAFVSPKSGRAVSLSAGLPYQNKLLKLPKFLLDDEVNNKGDQLLDGLELSGFFLKKVLLEGEFFNKNQQQFFYRDNILKSLREE